jgi:hypothetical protein
MGRAKTFLLIILSAYLFGIISADKKCATVYSECNFEGKSASICDDTPRIDFKIKSLKVPSGLEIEIYDDVDY